MLPAMNGYSTVRRSLLRSSKLALDESDGLVVVWATVDKHAGRARMKPFVVEAHTPGVTIAKVEEKLGIRRQRHRSHYL